MYKSWIWRVIQWQCPQWGQPLKVERIVERWADLLRLLYRMLNHWWCWLFFLVVVESRLQTRTVEWRRSIFKYKIRIPNSKSATRNPTLGSKIFDIKLYIQNCLYFHVFWQDLIKETSPASFESFPCSSSDPTQIHQQIWLLILWSTDNTSSDKCAIPQNNGGLEDFGDNPHSSLQSGSKER